MTHSSFLDCFWGANPISANVLYGFLDASSDPDDCLEYGAEALDDGGRAPGCGLGCDDAGMDAGPDLLSLRV